MSKILAVNAGSSSFKFQLLEMPEEVVITEGLFEKIGLADPRFIIKYNGQKEENIVDIKNHQDAVKMLLDALVNKGIVSSLNEIVGVGHRVVHCGEFYNDSVLMDDEAMENIKSIIDLAPLHVPANLIGIEAFKQVLPGVPNVGVFDTAFHATMEPEAYLYAVPYEWYKNYGVRKYGFHGTSHKYVAYEAAKQLGKNIEDLRIITCHMGNGVSLAAIKNGKVVDTTMGMTPLDGVPMGTRSGTIDPALIEFICKKENTDAASVVNTLNKKSGYIGFFKESSDARDLRKAQAEGNELADLIINIQEKKVVDFIGSYYAYMGGVDVIIFTAGLGEKAPETRHNICARLKEPFGIEINEELNKIKGEYLELTPKDAKIKVLVVPTNEELMIARDVMRIANIK